jgi:hypothetical protein
VIDGEKESRVAKLLHLFDAMTKQLKLFHQEHMKGFLVFLLN